MDTLILGCEPKIAGDYDIDNYFGFPETISGKKLIEKGLQQAIRFGVKSECDRVLSIHHDKEGLYKVKTEASEYLAGSIIFATGVSRKKPGISNLEEYDGKGVSYCESCDGFFFKNTKVMVLGEGNYAENQALELKEYTPNDAICTLDKENRISPEYMEELNSLEIPVIQKDISELKGNMNLERIAFYDGEERDVDGLFIALGDASSTDFAQSLGIFTEGNFLKVDREQKTNAPGIYAAGDCTGGFLQISVAVGEGAIAAKSAIEHVRNTVRKKNTLSEVGEKSA